MQRFEVRREGTKGRSEVCSVVMGGARVSDEYEGAKWWNARGVGPLLARPDSKGERGLESQSRVLMYNGR